ncbi:hypothetical protein PLESTB_001359600 [Pleodorina starrii]|uniref:Uncharacterized protein n=1 Tax=Pleodorina starrii TaxID=330485 RepID=A0A9W6BUT1_9CHLO|nr:hypothetical protein PLESTB_001359600 [Pleodorina starrii]
MLETSEPAAGREYGCHVQVAGPSVQDSLLVDSNGTYRCGHLSRLLAVQLCRVKGMLCWSSARRGAAKGCRVLGNL